MRGLRAVVRRGSILGLACVLGFGRAVGKMEIRGVLRGSTIQDDTRHLKREMGVCVYCNIASYPYQIPYKL